MSYKVIYSKRRTMAIQVKKDGEVIVRAPFGVKEHDIVLFVGKNKAWIEKNQEKIIDRETKRHNIAWKDGGYILLFGEMMRFHVTAGSSKQLKIDYEDNIIQIVTDNDSETEIEKLVTEWYKNKAFEIFKVRTAIFAEKMQIKYGKITIRGQVSRWGSCSAAGNLSFNWKLLMMPLDVIDYIIVHELAHRREMNHSKHFWDVVKEFMPDYEEKRGSLREYESKIKINP